MSFTTAKDRIEAVERVSRILGTLRTVHTFAKTLCDAKALYLAGTDPAFNAAFNAVFDVAGDRTELAGMIDQLTALAIGDWEANHASVLGS